MTTCPRASAGIPPVDGLRGTVAGKTAASRSARESQPWATMPSRTKFQRCSALSGLSAGSQRDGDWISPASSAPSAGVSSVTDLPK